MFKRRDWIYTKGQNGSDSDSEDNSSNTSSVSPSSSPPPSSNDGSARTSEIDETTDDPEVTDQKEPHGIGEDSAIDSEDTHQDLDTQLRLWESYERGVRPPGRALRCRLCPGVLILNATAFTQHVRSAKHTKRLAKQKQKEADPLCFCFADELRAEEEACETHGERAARIAAAAATAPLDVKAGKKRKGRRKPFGKDAARMAKRAKAASRNSGHVDVGL
eukprot:jgi/Botrbrau1/12622/Bobra.0169s0149.1